MLTNEWARYGRALIDGVTQLDAHFVGHVFERHSHDTFSIGVTTGGVQRFDCRGARHDSVPGDVVLFNPDEMHDGRAGADGGFRYTMLYVAPAALDDMLRGAADGAHCGHMRAPHVHDPALARALLAAIASLAQPGETLRAQALLARALRQVMSRHGDMPPPRVHASAALQRLNAVREFIDAHAGEDLRIETLAALAGLSRSHLTRAFSRAFGVAPHGHLNAVRLRRAQQALLQGQSIIDAAAASGFVDQSHFTRRFKGAFGVPPGAWLTQMHAPRHQAQSTA
jgi:AraC-like DNA-binding protein